MVARRHGQKALLHWAKRKQLQPSLSWRCLEAQVGRLAMEPLQPRIVRAARRQVGLAVGVSTLLVWLGRVAPGWRQAHSAD